MHRSPYIRAALLALIALILAAPAASADSAPLFEWSLPAAALGTNGELVETAPGEVGDGPWRVDFKVAGRACATATSYSWTADGKRFEPQPIGRCRFRHSFPRRGSYEVRLELGPSGEGGSEEQHVDVRNFLVVSIGDSVASGEGVPDEADPGEAHWQSVRCHRSIRSGPAQAARLLEEEDGHSSVTFVHLACSGATVPRGLLGGYQGIVPPTNEPPLEAQVSELNRIEARRPVDAVLISIGANDIHFGDIVRFCLLHPAANCFEETLPVSYGGDGVKTASEVIADSVAGLEQRYDELDAAISPVIPRDQIHVVEYFDPTHDSDGSVCESVLGTITAPELRLAKSEMLDPLNEALAAAAKKHGWDEVTGIAAAFHDHGYCAGNQTWITTLHRSAFDLGGSLSGRVLGMMHPNERGYGATANRIAASLERDLLPGQAFPARSDPAGDGDGGASLILVLIVLAVVLLAIVLLAALQPFWKPPKENPLRRIGKTARPLLLPLFVVVAVGSIRLGALGVILVSIGCLALAWFLFLRPSLEELGFSAKWGELRKRLEDLGERLPRYLLRLAALGAAVFVIAVPIFRNVPYFQTINDLSSGLVLFSLALWFAAIGLRLTSYADSRLRAFAALVAALALVRLAMAVGVFPGEPGREGGIPQTVVILGAILLVAVLTEILVEAFSAGEGSAGSSWYRALISWLRGGGLPKGIAKDAKALGLVAACAASVALLASTVYALIEAGERGKPLHPPEEVSLDHARTVAAAPELGGAGGLVREYAPVLAFTDEERWTPIPVDDYLANARLTGPDGSTEEGPLTPADLQGRRCPAGQPACYTLTIDCESGEEECAHGEPRERDDNRLYEEGAVYVRLISRSRQPGLFPPRGPFDERLQTLVQYWYFYYYDEWRSPVFAGLLTQKHEGDWEVVSIGLDSEHRPLFVADSAHCSGSWRYWNEVEVSTLPPGRYVHPLVAVAEGSHANYPDPDQKRTTDPAACAHAPAGVATALSFASNIRDKTEYGWAWYPPPGGWNWARADQAPISFPGSWGATDRTLLRNFNSHRIGADKHGPLSPPLQGSWARPVTTIFCGYRPPPQRPERATAGCAAGA